MNQILAPYSGENFFVLPHLTPPSHSGHLPFPLQELEREGEAGVGKGEEEVAMTTDDTAITRQRPGVC